MEISRWRQPPDHVPNKYPPRQGRRMKPDSSAPPGRIQCGVAIRWLTPPANFRPSLRDSAQREIMKALGQLEAEIQQGMKELEGMLK